MMRIWGLRDKVLLSLTVAAKVVDIFNPVDKPQPLSQNHNLKKTNQMINLYKSEGEALAER